jgi:hypothetical protein
MQLSKFLIYIALLAVESSAIPIAGCSVMFTHLEYIHSLVGKFVEPEAQACDRRDADAYYQTGC